MTNDLSQMLLELQTQHNLISLKGGTEWEDMDYDEIAYLKGISPTFIPVLVKVGGPEANVDLRHMREIGIDGILGPMIESQYSLEKFVSTVKNVYKDSQIPLWLSINIETINAFDKLDEILSSSSFNAINTVVIGRLDLSLSMNHTEIDHPEVTAVTKEIASRVKSVGKHVSVGGFVNPKSVDTLATFDIDRVNTIHCMVDTVKNVSIGDSVRKAIEFEAAFYNKLKSMYPKRNAFYENRIQICKKKLS